MEMEDVNGFLVITIWVYCWFCSSTSGVYWFWENVGRNKI